MWDCLSSLAKFAIFWTRREELLICILCESNISIHSLGSGIPSLCALPRVKEQRFLGLCIAGQETWIWSHTETEGCSGDRHRAAATSRNSSYKSRLQLPKSPCRRRTQHGMGNAEITGEGAELSLLPALEMDSGITAEGIVPQRGSLWCLSVCTALPPLLHRSCCVLLPCTEPRNQPG